MFGEFEAYSLLNETGDDFSEKGFELIKDFLHYNPMYFLKPSYQEKDGFLSEEERKLFIALVRLLPKSEQFVFEFKNQQKDPVLNQAFPSPDLLSLSRDGLCRLLNRRGGVPTMSYWREKCFGIIAL